MRISFLRMLLFELAQHQQLSFWASNVDCAPACFTTSFIGVQEVEAAAKKAQETAAQEEADRQKRIKDSYDAVVPDEIQQRVQAALQKEMVSSRLQAVAGLSRFLQ